MRERSLIILIGTGVASAGIYLLFFALRYPLVQYYMVPFQGLGSFNREADVVVYLAALAALFALYVLACRATRSLGDVRIALAVVLGFAFLFGIILIWTYPLGSADVFAYVFQGRVLAHYQINPFTVSAVDFPRDPVVSHVFSAKEPSIYGPLWVLVSGAAGFVYGDSLLLGAVVFKSLGVVLYLLTTVIIYLVVRKQRGETGVAGALLFAWNPLVLYETAANGHNDIAMVLLALLAAYALLAGRVGLAFPLLMAATLIKFLTVFLFPVFLLFWLRPGKDRWLRARLAIGGLLAAALLAVALYAPFWIGPETIGPLRRGELFTASLPALVYYFLSAFSLPEAGQMVRLGAGLLFGLYSIWRIWQVQRANDPFLEVGFDLILAHLALATFWFQPWYLISLMAFAAVVAGDRRRRLTVVFCASALLNYVVFSLAFAHPEWVGFFQVQVLLVVSIFLPPFAFLIFARWSQLRAQATS